MLILLMIGFLRIKKILQNQMYVKSWIDQGLESRAITRDLDWGIWSLTKMAMAKFFMFGLMHPLAISSTKEWAKNENKDWELYWKDKNTKLIHFIGKII